MAKHAAQQVQSSIRAGSHFMRPTAVALAVAACFNGPVLANPVNPTVVSGAATFATAGNILNITNSHNAIINWGSFSIGVNELTRFIQPSALSAVLNRVTGQDPSAILGALQSNGRVFLLNPNGIVFGAGSQINVAGLVASTLNLSNDDFLNNRMRFTDGAGAGSVVNQGSITGGSVYLVGKAVSNQGLITSPNGEVVLAAGNSVELVNPGTPNLRVEVVAPDNEARNLGTITAEAGRIGIYAGLIKQSGTLSADSAVAEGGRIMLKSTKNTTLEAGSVTSARGTSGGQILALSDMTNGVTHVAGRLDASAITSANPGNGGFIETSAAKIQVADSATITTLGSNGGQAGTWLLDPADFIIGASGDLTATALVSALSGGNVVISTVSVGDSNFYGGATGSSGDILVQQAVSWGNSNSLTLTAYGNVQVDQAITNSGTGAIRLNAGWDMTSPASTPTLTNSSAAILLNAPVSTGGMVRLQAGGDIIQGGSAPINAASLLAISENGVVSLNNPGSMNTVGTLAGNARRSFAFRNSGDLTIGTVDGENGITVNPASGGSRNATINIDVAGGQLTVNKPVIATAGADGAEGTPGGNASINLTSSSSMQIDSTGNIAANGGQGGYGYYSTPAGNGGNATVTLNSGGGLVINGSVYANGGLGGVGSSGANSGRGGDGVVSISAAGALAIGATTVRGQGGTGGYAYYGGQAGRGGDGKVMLSAVGGITVASGAQVQGYGGNGGSGGSYYYGGSALGGNGGDGVVELTSTGGGITVSGSVRAQGGAGGSGGSSGSGNGNGGNAALSLVSAGAITITGQASATGGEESYSGYYSTSTGGNATVLISAAGPVSMTNAFVSAQGGDGGENGMGGNALLLVSSGGGLTVSNSSFSARGGYGNSGQGGAAAVTLLAGGNLQIDGSEGSAWGGGGAAGGNAALTLASIGGDININPLTYLSTSVSSGGMGSVVATAAGNVSINSANIDSDGLVGLFGANISMNDGNVYGAGGILVNARGGLSLINESNLVGGGIADITTGGNVLVDQSRILGNPDVVMKVGGVIDINGTMSVGGRIEASSPSTIHLDFTGLTSGGFSINGIPGVVYDPLTNTGFFANGSPASIGNGLIVTYSGTTTTLSPPTDTLIVAMGSSTKPPDPEKDKDVFEDVKDSKKKDAPVCR